MAARLSSRRVGHPPTLIRRCAAAQREAAIETLAEALAEDPQLHWYGAGKEGWPRLAIAVDVDAALGEDELWAAGELDAVAAWSPPLGGAERRERVEAGTGTDAAATALDPVKRAIVGEYERALAAELPGERAWYLEAIGTRPARRRLGYATALLRPALARCDREGLAALADTSNPAAIGFYETLGFSALAEIATRGMPPGWLLRRPPGHA